jgi:CRP/FNR family transcriptional regulator, cyclic AMP receptor protein
MDLIDLFQHETGYRSIAAGQAIFTEGDAGHVMYVLIEGQADILIGSEIVEVVGPGAILGEMAIIDHMTRSAAVVAHSDCRLLPINVQRFDTLIQKNPDFARHVMKVMADRVRNMNRRNQRLIEHILRF